MRAPATKRPRPALTVSARLSDHVTLEVQPGGTVAVHFGGYSIGLGAFGADAVACVPKLRAGLPLGAFASSRAKIAKEIATLVRRLAQHGLLEFRLGSARGMDLVVIEPQGPDYWPHLPKLGDSDALVLSRFAYLRRRADVIVLESPRAGALFRIGDPRVAAILASLSVPRQVKQLRREGGFPGIEFLALLLDSKILFKLDVADDRVAKDIGLRSVEGDDQLVLWDFHDLVFHARSTEGRHANPMGGVFPYAGVIPPLPAVRPRWPGKKVDLRRFPTASPEAMPPLAKLLRERHSTRSFDDLRPITLAELSQFLEATARVRSREKNKLDLGNGGPTVEYAIRPYPSAGAGYELELYLAVDQCDGLTRGFYHYDAAGHALVPIGVPANALEMQLTGAKYAMGAPAAPQILVTIAARFGRIAWKYSSIAYALILKDVGVLMQTLYLMATDVGLGGCAIGTVNIDLFAKMTGIEFHIEGAVGQFALGRGTLPTASD